jgi:hypothetical protein
MTEQGGRKPPLLSDNFPNPAGVKLQEKLNAITMKTHWKNSKVAVRTSAHYGCRGKKRVREAKHPHPYFYRTLVKGGKKYRAVIYLVTVHLPTMVVRFGQSVERRLQPHRIEVQGETHPIR